MNDPTQLMQIFQEFKKNPMAMLGRCFNIPQGINNPQDIIQHLLNTNQVSQAQVNQAMQARNDPRLRNLFR